MTLSLAEKFYKGMRFKYRKDWGDADLMVFNGVIRDDEYMVEDLPIPIGTCIDVGANLGTFAIRLWKRQPECEIALVEVDSDNIELLTINTEAGSSRIFNGALHYSADLKLYSSVFEGTHCTGGSMIVKGSDSIDDPRYRLKEIKQRFTLEHIMWKMNFKTLDLLKLDCEGSEHNILENAKCLHKIGVIIGEWHGKERFNACLERFDTEIWDIDFLNCSRDQELGIFRLCQKNWWNMKGENA